MLLLLTSLLACSPAPKPEAQPAAEAAPAAAAPAAPTAQPAAEPAGEPAAEAQAAPALGAPFTATNVVPVDTLVADSATWDGKPVVVEATVKEVCQKKGCWHTLATANPDVTVMVRDKEYGIFLPKDSAGKKVYVKGTFSVAQIPQDEARHYAEDAGRDASTINGPQRTFAIEADGVQFLGT